MKAAPPKSASLSAWIDRAAHDAGAAATFATALAASATGEAQAAFATSEAELLATLNLLEELDLDSETRAAYILHTLQQCGIALTSVTLAQLAQPMRDLIEGQIKENEAA